MDGILPLWKPRGMTSHDCVMKVRRLFQMKKVGHTGTLDPEVEGVLPLCLGKATKIVPYLMEADKTYVADVTLGTATDTEDSEGNVVEQAEAVLPSEQTIANVLQSFTGEITQIPPMYSAVKVNGKRLYEYARANETVERPKRKVTIYNIMQVPATTDHENTFKIKVLCSKGTYIRTLCVDIGKRLGYPAHMSDLVRTATGSFTKEMAIPFATIEEAVRQSNQHQLLLPMIRGLLHLDRLYVDAEIKEKVLHGQKLAKPANVPTIEPFIVMFHDQLLAIYHTHPEKPGLIKPVRVFQG